MRARMVPTTGVGTPLLVPSFSSRGFPNVAAIYEFLAPEVPEASLVSAYDLHHRSLPLDSTKGSDVVFVDSGGYEAKLTYDPDEAYVDDRQGKAWSFEQYLSVLDGLEPSSQVVVVNFDYAGPLTLAEQVASASSLFARYPRYASDFLAKPTAADAQFVDAASIASDIECIARSFCIPSDLTSNGTLALKNTGSSSLRVFSDRSASIVEFESVAPNGVHSRNPEPGGDHVTFQAQGKAMATIEAFSIQRTTSTGFSTNDCRVQALISS